MAEPVTDGAVPSSRQVPFPEAVRVWARIAVLSFGGPAGQIAVMHRILVEEKRWIGDERFLHALNFCMLLPGPEAQQLATYIGWLMHKTKGGLVAGALFVLPGFVAIMALSWLYVLLGDVADRRGLFFGLKAAVLAIVLQAVIRVGSPRARATAPGGRSPPPPSSRSSFRRAVPGDRRSPPALIGFCRRPGRRRALSPAAAGTRSERHPRCQTATRRSATACPTMRGPTGAGRCGSRRRSCCCGWRRSPRCWSRSGPTTSSAASPPSSAKWRW